MRLHFTATTVPYFDCKDGNNPSHRIVVGAGGESCCLSCLMDGAIDVRPTTSTDHLCEILDSICAIVQGEPTILLATLNDPESWLRSIITARGARCESSYAVCVRRLVLLLASLDPIFVVAMFYNGLSDETHGCSIAQRCLLTLQLSDCISGVECDNDRGCLAESLVSTEEGVELLRLVVLRATRDMRESMRFAPSDDDEEVVSNRTLASLMAFLLTQVEAIVGPQALLPMAMELPDLLLVSCQTAKHFHMSPCDIAINALALVRLITECDLLPIAAHAQQESITQDEDSNHDGPHSSWNIVEPLLPLLLSSSPTAVVSTASIITRIITRSLLAASHGMHDWMDLQRTFDHASEGLRHCTDISCEALFTLASQCFDTLCNDIAAGNERDTVGSLVGLHLLEVADKTLKLFETSIVPSALFTHAVRISDVNAVATRVAAIMKLSVAHHTMVQLVVHTMSHPDAQQLSATSIQLLTQNIRVCFLDDAHRQDAACTSVERPHEEVASEQAQLFLSSLSHWMLSKASECVVWLATRNRSLEDWCLHLYHHFRNKCTTLTWDATHLNVAQYVCDVIVREPIKQHAMLAMDLLTLAIQVTASGRDAVGVGHSIAQSILRCVPTTQLVELPRTVGCSVPTSFPQYVCEMLQCDTALGTNLLLVYCHLHSGDDNPGTIMWQEALQGTVEAMSGSDEADADTFLWLMYASHCLKVPLVTPASLGVLPTSRRAASRVWDLMMATHQAPREDPSMLHSLYADMVSFLVWMRDSCCCIPTHTQLLGSTILHSLWACGNDKDFVQLLRSRLFLTSDSVLHIDVFKSLCTSSLTPSFPFGDVLRSGVSSVGDAVLSVVLWCVEQDGEGQCSCILVERYLSAFLMCSRTSDIISTMLERAEAISGMLLGAILRTQHIACSKFERICSTYAMDALIFHSQKWHHQPDCPPARVLSVCILRDGGYDVAARALQLLATQASTWCTANWDLLQLVLTVHSSLQCPESAALIADVTLERILLTFLPSGACADGAAGPMEQVLALCVSSFDVLVAQPSTRHHELLWLGFAVEACLHVSELGRRLSSLGLYLCTLILERFPSLLHHPATLALVVYLEPADMASVDAFGTAALHSLLKSLMDVTPTWSSSRIGARAIQQLTSLCSRNPLNQPSGCSSRIQLYHNLSFRSVLDCFAAVSFR